MVYPYLAGEAQLRYVSICHIHVTSAIWAIRLLLMYLHLKLTSQLPYPTYTSDPYCGIEKHKLTMVKWLEICPPLKDIVQNHNDSAISFLGLVSREKGKTAFEIFEERYSDQVQAVYQYAISELDLTSDKSEFYFKRTVSNHISKLKKIYGYPPVALEDPRRHDHQEETEVEGSPVNHQES